MPAANSASSTTCWATANPRCRATGRRAMRSARRGHLARLRPCAASQRACGGACLVRAGRTPAPRCQDLRGTGPAGLRPGPRRALARRRSGQRSRRGRTGVEPSGWRSPAPTVQASDSHSRASRWYAAGRWRTACSSSTTRRPWRSRDRRRVPATPRRVPFFGSSSGARLGGAVQDAPAFVHLGLSAAVSLALDPERAPLRARRSGAPRPLQRRATPPRYRTRTTRPATTTRDRPDRAPRPTRRSHPRVPPSRMKPDPNNGTPQGRPSTARLSRGAGRTGRRGRPWCR